MFRYAVRDLVRNPRRTLSTLVGVALGVGLFSGVLFFIDASGATMTQRALAPVDIDLQRVLSGPLGQEPRLTQRLEPRGAAASSTRAEMVLTVANPSAGSTAHDVLVKDRLPAGLTYVAGSAMVDGTPLPDEAGASPFSHGPGHTGHSFGTVEPGRTLRMSYRVTAAGQVPSRIGSARLSWREHPLPVHANPPAAIGLDELEHRVAAVPGVASADRLAFAQLAPGSVRSADARVDRSVKIFGFAPSYADHYPDVRLTSGTFASGAALLSPTSARTLHVAIGDDITVNLPDGGRPLRLPVSGIVDLSRARSLFNSREGAKLEDFLYLPDSVVLPPAIFHDRVLPAFRDAAARGIAAAVKSPPTLEVDAVLDRGPLATDPARALQQTQRIGHAVEATAPGDDFVLDNASNALTVAAADAASAKKMFGFLGLPGLVLAGALAAYAGAVLAAAQRREQAILRLRGASQGHLTAILFHRTVLLAGAGAVIGTAFGVLSCAMVLGASSLQAASPTSLLTSAGIAVAAGVVAPGAALFIPSHQALRREVVGEQRILLSEERPRWRRWRLDWLLALASAIAVVVAVRAGAFDAPSGNVTLGRATELNAWLLAVPLMAWLAGSLLGGRTYEAVAGRLPIPPAPRFGTIVRGVLVRTMSRRARQAFPGVACIVLVVAFSTGLAMFAASYDSAKATDARFTVGSDARVTPGPSNREAQQGSYAPRLRVPGVAEVTPVVASLDNATLRSTFNGDVQDLAAVDASRYARTTGASDAAFVDLSARQALGALSSRADAILVDEQTAEGLKLDVGDEAELLMARGTSHQQLRTMHVAGMFRRLPGFPGGVQVVMNLDYYHQQTRTTSVDFFLVRSSGSGHDDLTAMARAIRNGPGTRGRLTIDTVETSFNKDQSSLTALNIRGLLRLDAGYTLAIITAAIAIFVIGLMLHRRKEYIIVMAQGLTSRQLVSLLAGEAGAVAGCALIAGLVVGSALGAALVNTLTPLFILEPPVVFPVATLVLLAGLVGLATLVSVVVARSILRSLSPSEVLREQ